MWLIVTQSQVKCVFPTTRTPVEKVFPSAFVNCIYVSLCTPKNLVSEVTIWKALLWENARFPCFIYQPAIIS